MAESWENELVEDLIEASNKNFELTGDDARKTAMENIAAPIAKAIKNGRSLEIKGSATVAEINNLLDIEDGDIYAVSDSGIIRNSDGTKLNATAGDLVIYRDGVWNTLLHIDLSGYATTAELKAAFSIAVKTVEQNLSDDEKTQARDNIDAQQTLTWDTEPTESSVNPVTSQGIKTYVDSAVSIAKMRYLSYCTTLEFGSDIEVIGLPAPAYELPATTFNRDSVVNSYYRLMDTAGTSGSLDEWTLFCNVIENGQTSDDGRRLMCCGGAGTGGDSNVCAGMYKSGAKCIGCYQWGSPWYSFGGGTGKLAYRRSKGLEFIQYTLDGCNWIDTVEVTANIRTHSSSYWGWLSFGGVVSRTDRCGIGTISAKLWKTALDDISDLF